MSIKILVADDDQVERTALREILKADGRWEITEVSDGREALDLLCDGLRPALCLFDIKMPRMDGIELLQRMRRDPDLKDTKVVVTSANRDRDVIVALAKLQISGYLLKPYNPEKTLAMLQQLSESMVAKPSLASRNLLAKTVLLAEDDAVARAALRGMIAAEPNWEVVEAKDGQDALDQLRAGLRPDLGIFDLNMPRLDGYSLIQSIREDPQLRKIRVVAITAEPDREKVKLLAQLQIASYLVKPVTPAKIRALLSGGEPAAAPEEQPKV